MKKAIFLLIGVLICSISFCQNQKGLSPRPSKSKNKSGTKRAVIVGVSDYQNENIPDLQYAHIDAQHFADYLQSNAGGNVKKEHIELLLNEQATAGKFISALYTLLEESKEGDEAVIYFSGHGDVESSIMNQPGFLLCWDAPGKVYMAGGTFGLSYLKEIIATLTTINKAKVTVITDACRSGNLAGNDSGGAQATASYLAQQFANEIKIMSCQPNEFALEGANWGGGRGVFSYYLLKGLEGAADNNDDYKISLKEIQRYLEDHVAEQVSPHDQNPLTVGDRNAMIAQVNSDYQKAESDPKQGLSTVSGRDISISSQDSTLSKLIAQYEKAITQNHLLYPEESSAWSILQKLQEQEAFIPYQGIYKRNLAAILQDEAQQSINDYLEAKSEELLRRWTFDQRYNRFPEYLEKAALLLGEAHFYYSTLRARAYYFKGLQLRLEGEYAFDSTRIKRGLIFQDSCLTIDTIASFAMNEKGYIHYLLDDYKKAITFFNQSLEYSPKWTLPYVNLSNAYRELNQYEMAEKKALKALSIDSTNSLALFSLSTTMDVMGEQSKSEKILKNILLIDSSNYQVYDRLGIYTFEKNNFIDTERYWLRSYQLNDQSETVNNNLGHLYLAMDSLAKSKYHFQRLRDIRPNAIEAFQGMIEYHFYTGDLVQAKEELIAYTSNYSNDNFAYYLLSSIDAKQANTSSSLAYLEKALSKGFDQWELLEQDENFSIEFKNSRSFKDLIAKYK